MTLSLARKRRRTRWRMLLVASGLLWIAALGMLGWLDGRIAWVTAHRIGHAYELEFQEGDHALAAMRVLDGKPLYPQHNGDYIPLLYTPLTHYLSAAIMKATGQRTLFAGRLMALLATFGCLFVLAAWVWRETHCWPAALAAAMLFYAIAPLTGWWFDLYRVDMPALFFTLMAAWLLFGRKRGRLAEIAKGIAAGTLLTLAVFTKQSSAPLAVGLVLVAWPISLWRGLLASAAGLVLGSLTLAWLIHDYPDFWFYCFTAIKTMPFNLVDWQTRVWVEFFKPALPLEIFALLFFLCALARRHWRWILLLPVLIMALAITLRGLLKLGGYVNHYLVTWLVLALLAGLFLGALPRFFGRRLRGWGILLAPALLLAAALWLGDASGALVWSWTGLKPFPWQVSQADILDFHLPPDVKENEAMIRFIRQLNGSVWVLHHNYYAWLAGHEPTISVDSVRDLTIGGQPVSPYVLNLINTRKYKYLLLNDTNIQSEWLDEPVRQAIMQNYEFKADLEQAFGWLALRPVDKTGMKPRALWMRRGG